MQRSWTASTASARRTAVVSHASSSVPIMMIRPVAAKEATFSGATHPTAPDSCSSEPDVHPTSPRRCTSRTRTAPASAASRPLPRTVPPIRCGRRTAARSCSHRHCALYLVHPDGAGETMIPEDACAFSPDWSPDGKWIVFSLNQPEGSPDLFVAPADGTNPSGSPIRRARRRS
jgi:hypothetical protein